MNSFINLIILDSDFHLLPKGFHLEAFLISFGLKETLLAQ